METTATKKPVKKVPASKASEPSTQNLEPKISAIFAVILTGGKQYRVKVGDKIKIEKLVGEYKEGDKLIFNQVLLTDDGKSDVTVGTPAVKGASVKATLYKIARYKTVDVIKYKQKSRYFKKYGHRQPYFEVIIDSIK